MQLFLSSFLNFLERLVVLLKCLFVFVESGVVFIQLKLGLLELLIHFLLLSFQSGVFEVYFICFFKSFTFCFCLAFRKSYKLVVINMLASCILVVGEYSKLVKKFLNLRLKFFFNTGDCQFADIAIGEFFVV